ncbi:sce7726 family protein [Candidatus Sumerlaeota bacterium]|nr:sce7726 family protein [Candidatus Sumerlaeota bacterium]
MNDQQIRASFHRKRLGRHHAAPDTLVVDELGLNHGRCRADIAVINGRLIGYEIKSDEDTLYRLGEQIEAYNNIFDCITVVVAGKHAKAIRSVVPCWWGIVLSVQGPRGGISFETARPPRSNPRVDPFSVAQLLWKNEAISILAELGVPPRVSRVRREFLYRVLADDLSLAELRHRVSQFLRDRRNWRCQTRLSRYDGSSLPSSR